MRYDQNKLYIESAAVLEAQLSCAVSLHATSSEIRSLLDSGKMELVQERYFSRGEIFNMMISLDQQMDVLLSEAKRTLPENIWQSLIMTGKKIHDLMLSIMSIDKNNQKNVEQKCEEIRQSIGMIKKDKNNVQKYAAQPAAEQSAGCCV